MGNILTFTANNETSFKINQIEGVKEVPLVDFSELKLVGSYDPILKEKMPPFDFKNPEFDPISFAHALVKIMIDSNGLGLSANQVGIRTRCFAILGEPNLVCYNPYIIGYGEEEVSMEEGCLSYPNLYVKIKRKKNVKVRFTMPNGETVTKTFADLSEVVL